MSFSFRSAGSANNIDQLRSSGSSKPEEEDGIPQRVDAHDYFEQGEIPCSDAADQKLAKEVNNIKLHLVLEEPECSKMQNLKACFTAKAPVNSGVDGSKQREKKSAMPKKGTGGGRSGNLVIRDEPLGSDEMIPALRGLSSISSFGMASLSLDLHDFVLGKRQAISEIRTSTNRLVQDVLAWAPDPKGVCSVRSAYHLAHEEKLRASREASSRAPDGTRAIWKVLLGCMAPPKVRVFAWRVATNSLATAANLLRRNMGVSDTCVICGKEREDTFHALCTCPLAQCLWRDMVKSWNMPKLEDIQNTGTEWRLHLLDQCKPDQRLPVLMTLLRSWHVHNELTHGKQAPPTEASTRFLSSNIQTLQCIKQFPRGDLVKGKMVPSHQGKLTANQKEEVQPKDRVQRWTKPPPGWTKLNINGDFSEGNKTGGAGMILRDEEGQVIFSSCRYLRTCSSALEAELAACLEGISIARAWSELPMIIELDCSCAVQMIVEEGIDRSPHATLVMQLKQALGEIGEHVISHVVRSRNALADALARLGRINHRTAVWLRGIPEEVDTLCKHDSVG
ncbi:hypothetical protein ZWY2020_043875 [Hordeum vulgare]|nr:hypothetical protein ZWY2020_043875 [Hordeum vulgare]